jgi:hypothetical protein
MPIYTTRKFLLFLFISLSVGVLAVSATTATLNHFFPPQPKVATLQARQEWYIPGNNLLFNHTISRLQSLNVSVKPLDPSLSNQTLSRIVTPGSVIILDSAWIASRVNDNQALTFLRIVIGGGARVVAIGDQTSALFDALKNAGLFNFDQGRNPGYYNPPMAGYYPSHLLFSNTTDVDTLIDALNQWA